MKPNLIIRMGAPHWDARVRKSDDTFVEFNLRTMARNERSAFHRELMNAFRGAASAARATQQVAE